MSQGNYMELETRYFIVRDVIEALKDDAIHKIGIWGMPGVGKTTLANEVLNKAKKEHLFDEVAMAAVSQKQDFKGIQESIAVYLGMKFDEGNPIGRTHRLYERLAQVGKKKLIVLDDVWGILDLDEIGIPCGDDFKGCKIVLTTRDKDVCDQMSIDRDFHLKVLDKEEARRLFKNKADYSYYDCDWRSIAEGIVDECGGLPLAITTIATTLINKKEVTWANVLMKLKNATFDKPYAKVYEALRVSYDFLESDGIKNFFLLCCLFPEDSDIPIEELLRYGVGRRLFENTNDLHEARIQAYAHVEKLQNSNLLLSTNEGYVKMHDLIRDFAISIASSGKHVKGWPWPKPMEDSYSGSSISLQLDENYQLPNRLRCPNLKLLRLAGERRFGVLPRELPEGFFEGMGNLQVMALGRMVVQSLPEGLISLRTLSLSYCQLKGDVSIIGNLQSLEILSFASSDIEELPREIAKLTRLRLLDLTYCRKLRTIAAGVLSSLTCLEELYMRRIAFKWKEEVGASSQEDESSASFNDLKKLAKLIALEIKIPYEVSPTGLIFNNLKKFNISVAGKDTLWNWLDDDDDDGVGNRLVLRADKSVQVEGLINRLCSKAVYLCFLVKDLKSLPEELEREGFFKLRSLKLVSCGGLVSIVNKMGQYTANVFPKLESLYLHNLGNLEVLCHGQHSKQGSSLPSSSMNQLVSFGKLRNLELRGCNKLKSIFSLSIAKNLINLEELEIKECQMLEEIISEEGGDPNEIEIAGRKIVLPRLRLLTLESLPKLVAFSKALVEVELPLLEKMTLRGLTKVTSLYPGGETLASENDQHCLFKHKEVDNLNNKCERGTTVAALKSEVIQQLQNLESLELGNLNSIEGFQNMKQLIINECDSLRHLFTSSMAKILVELEILEVSDCKLLEAIVAEEEEEGGEEGILFPKLKYLILKGLPNLLTVKDCGKGAEAPLNDDKLDEGDQQNQ